MGIGGLVWLLCTYSIDDCPVQCLQRHQEVVWVETDEGQPAAQVRDVCDVWDVPGGEVEYDELDLRK